MVPVEIGCIVKDVEIKTESLQRRLSVLLMNETGQTSALKWCESLKDSIFFYFCILFSPSVFKE
jgi:hypothetical protein